MNLIVENEWLITGIFIFIMILFFVYFFRTRKNSSNLASIVTVLGVLGTFVGIAIGLISFDPVNIEKSVPGLLAGLKLAFITSIAGIFFSIIIKTRELNRGFIKEKEIGDDIVQGATIDDIVRELKNLSKNQIDTQVSIKNSLSQLEKSLTGDGETTVVTQLQKIRTTIGDKQDEMISEFKKFATAMVENSSKYLIEALESVIRDFNAKINEQFGENFAKLNEAVGRMLEWQEQYKEQMEVLANQILLAAKSIEASERSLNMIKEHAERIGENADKLNEILKATEEEVYTLEEWLKVFGEVAEKATDAFPIIEQNLQNLTSEFSSHVKSAIESSQMSSKALVETLEKQAEVLDRTITNTRTNIEDGIKKSNENLITVINTQRERMQDVIKDTRGNMEALQRETTNMLAEQIKKLDQQLSTQLNESLGYLGNSLKSLSRHFVEDYRPLTDQLKNVVQLANALPKIETSPRDGHA